MNDAFSKNSAALERGTVVDMYEHLTTTKYHRGEGRIWAVSREDQPGERSLHHNACLCIRCGDNSRMQRNLDLNVAINFV